MARRRRVLILFWNPLLAASLQSLLEAEEGLEVAMTGASGAQEPVLLRRFRPQVIIAEGDVGLSADVDNYARTQGPMLIRLSLEDTVMRVSYAQEISPAGTQDLVAAIRSRRPSLRSRRQRQEVDDGRPWLQVG